jgi:hypothetical protein
VASVLALLYPQTWQRQENQGPKADRMVVKNEDRDIVDGDVGVVGVR